MAWTWAGKWLQDPRFDGLAPIDTCYRHSERAKRLLEIAAAHRPNLSNVHMLLRKTFRLGAAARAARIWITADDCYKLWVNGHYVGQGPAQQHPWRYYFNEWDTTAFLRVGENTLAAHVYYQGLPNHYLNSMDQRMGLVAEARIELDGGGEALILSDASWRYKIIGCETNVGPEEIKRQRSPEHYYAASFSGGMAGYFTGFQENVDARRIERGWREAGFDDSHWGTPSVVDLAAKDYVFFAQPTPPVETYRMKPRSVVLREPGRYVADFGEEVAGAVRLRQSGRDGHVVEIRHGEELNPDGSVRWRMRCSTEYREFWTLSGEREQELEPYGYKGFRYVEVIGAVDPVTADNLCVEARRYPWPAEAARFECSLPALNRIWDICARGVRLCAQEVYVDCPQREKGQYLGDVTVTGHAHMLLTGDGRLCRKALDDFAQSARITPFVQAAAPGNLHMEIADYSMQYPLLVEQYFRQTGDVEAVREFLPVAEAMLEAFRARYADAGGLLRGVNDMVVLVDHPVNMTDDYDAAVGTQAKPGRDDCVSVLNAFYLGALMSRNRLRRIVGREAEDVAPLAAEFRRRFWDAGHGLFVDAEGSRHCSLHANTLPLLFGLAPEGGRESIVAFLRRKRMACGVYFAYFLLNALCDNGERNLAFDLMTCYDARSWQSMLKAGATACLEAWTPDLKENCSFCHAWSAAPIPVLVERVFGLSPAAPGWRRARFEPWLPPSLEWAELEAPTPAGRFRVAMRRGRDGLACELDAPAGVRVDRGIGRE
ncbi:MAG TPA: family 78 glycoside hydrolase catalytic domain [Candidatus Brocadiia bacterium]|nr:family 78 glycoside hydrolase catalytic domain [Candidatus Brocadiia bacterium]